MIAENFRCVALIAAFAGALHAQAPAPAAPTPPSPLFTSDQAAAGNAAYAQNCATCHGVNLDDGEFAPPLRSASFIGKYAGKPAADLFTYTSTKMPPGNPGSLGGPVYAQILAYILQQNGLPTGKTEFASN